MIAHFAWLTLRLNVRNRLAMIYGFAFPLIFLAAFVALYRNEPIALRMGELLTVTILGGACFGLPTALVAERERGVWRRYRLTPVPAWRFMAALLLARLVLLLAAGAIQLGAALAIGMTAPTDTIGLLVAFIAASIAFMGLGLVIAMLADSVPAVQALGQCIFLPMLIIGGVAVRLSSLPDWAQHLSAFFPGRYAVEALRATVTGAGVAHALFPLAALLAIGLAAGIAAARMFRWDPRARGGGVRHGGWVALALAMWLGVGLAAERRGQVVAPAPEEAVVPPPATFIAPPTALKRALPATRPEAPMRPKPAQPTGWRSVTPAEIARVAFDRLPADTGIVAPVALFSEAPDPAAEPALAQVTEALPNWAPARVADSEQRVRNLLCVAAVPDLLRMESIERFVPVTVFTRIRAEVPRDDLTRILYWIALHPDGGGDMACRQLAPLGLPTITEPAGVIRPRVMLYALKLLGRLTGDIVQR